jgi:hypothetical protein
MPFDVAAAIAAIALPFIIFAGVLFWGDLQTRGLS